MAGEPVFLVGAMPAAGEFLLDGEEGRHAAMVRRMRPGEQLILTDGEGSWAPATVTAVDRAAVTVRVGAAATDPPPALRVVLVQALPKGERSDLAVDLATESGVDAIVPWQAARCVARWTGSPDKPERGRQRWQSVAREAAKQSRRTRVPRVLSLASTAEVVTMIRAAAGALVLHEAGSSPISAVSLPAAGDLVVVVGPEGGISPDELDQLTAAGAVAVRLGREVLRTSAASAVALGALGALTDRWR
jgi:16S rRNA (uracil1498-N3)-methyltransferase